MPNNQSHLDYQAECLVALRGQWQDIERVIEIQNQAIRAAIACPNPLRTAKDCRGCNRAECATAWDAQDKMWRECDK